MACKRPQVASASFSDCGTPTKLVSPRASSDRHVQMNDKRRSAQVDSNRGTKNSVLKTNQGGERGCHPASQEDPKPKDSSNETIGRTFLRSSANATSYAPP